jgi:NAD(P)-dependent dehydrogenase (short-subunit alcohol dehydrogenase family)
MNQSQPAPEAIGTQQFRLDGDVALVTGATGHLGSVMAEALAAAGAHVLINSRRQQAADDLADSLRRRGMSASAAAFDITDANATGDMVRQLSAQHAHIDILVNNAHAGRPGPISEAIPSDFSGAFSGAVESPFFLARQLLPLLEIAGRRRRGGASIINISSMYGSVSPDPAIYGDSGQNSAAYYGAAKGALNQLGRYLAVHLAPRGIRVNTLSPGPFPGTSTRQNAPEFVARLASRVPLGRVGDALELCGPLLFLASPASAYVTGANLPVDGGWTAW